MHSHNYRQPEEYKNQRGDERDGQIARINWHVVLPGDVVM